MDQIPSQNGAWRFLAVLSGVSADSGIRMVTSVRGAARRAVRDASSEVDAPPLNDQRREPHRLSGLASHDDSDDCGERGQ